MDKFATLEPVKLYASTAASFRRASHLPSPKAPVAPFSRIGRLPVDVHLLILTYAAVPDIPAYSLASRALAKLSADERVWEARWKAFGIDKLALADVLDDLEGLLKAHNGARKELVPPTLTVDVSDDDFGDFTTFDASAPPAGDVDDFVSGFASASILSPVVNDWSPAKPTFRTRYIRAHGLLKHFVPALHSPPHAVLGALFPPPAPPPSSQARTLRLLSLYFSHRVKPVREWDTLDGSLRAAMDLFGENLLTAFDASDSKGDEKTMAEVAQASWDVWDSAEGQWELARAWADKHEIFYDHQSKWDPLENFT